MSYDPVPGMRVICIPQDAGWWLADDGVTNAPGVRFPVDNEVLTIREVDNSDGHGPWLRFHEIHNAPDSDGEEPCFYYLDFLPIDERRLDVFRETLKSVPAPSKVTEEA